MPSLADLVVLPAGLHALGLEEPTPYVPLEPPAPMLAEPYSHKAPRDLESVFEPADVIDQQVQLALSVVRASGASVSEDGHRFGDITKIDDSAATRIADEGRRALARLVSAGDIIIDSLTVDTAVAANAAELSIDYRNLRAPSRTQKRNVKKVIG